MKTNQYLWSMTDTAIKSLVTRPLLITLKSIILRVSLKETPHSFVICQTLGFLCHLLFLSCSSLVSFLFIFLVVVIITRNLIWSEIWFHVGLGCAPLVWHSLLGSLQISFSERKLLGLLPKNCSFYSVAVVLNKHLFILSLWCRFFVYFFLSSLYQHWRDPSEYWLQADL